MQTTKPEFVDISNDPQNPSRRNLLSSGAAALGATLLPAGNRVAPNAAAPDESRFLLEGF